MTVRRLAPRIGSLALGLLAAACSTESADTASGNASPERAVAEFAVEGMTCGGCALATVRPDRIAEAIRDAGFEPRLREGGSG